MSEGIVDYSTAPSTTRNSKMATPWKEAAVMIEPRVSFRKVVTPRRESGAFVEGRADMPTKFIDELSATRLDDAISAAR